MRRLMPTIMALPSMAVRRSSKCSTMSWATMATRFSAPTSASRRAHLLLSFSFFSTSSPSVTSSKSRSTCRQLGLVELQLRQRGPRSRWGPSRRPRRPAGCRRRLMYSPKTAGVLRSCSLDGRAGEADERGVGQGVAHVAGEAVYEVVLAAVGLVGDDDDVAPVGEERVLAPLSPAGTSGSVVKTTPPAATVSNLAQVIPALGLHRGSDAGGRGRREGAEELVVQVVAVGEDDERRVRHRRVADDLPA